MQVSKVRLTSCDFTNENINFIAKSWDWCTVKKNSVPFVPVFMQSMPSCEFFSTIWRDLMSANVWIGAWPLFSANAIGIDSSASANALRAYCSNVATYNDNRDINGVDIKP